MWPEFGNFSISMRSYHNLSFIRIWPEKPFFLRGSVGWSSIIQTGTWYGLEILHQCDERVKTKSQKILGAKSYVCRSYRAKTGKGWMGLPPILNRVNSGIKYIKECPKFEGNEVFCINKCLINNQQSVLTS